MVTIRRGEIWWAGAPREMGRPYLVLTRDSAIDVLARVLIAPVTRRVRSIPTEVARGPEDGLATAWAASFDHADVPEVAARAARRRPRTGSRAEICTAINAAIDC